MGCKLKFIYNLVLWIKVYFSIFLLNVNMFGCGKGGKGFGKGGVKCYRKVFWDNI